MALVLISLETTDTRHCQHRLAALAWVLGLGLPEVTAAFATQGVKLNRLSIWRESWQLVAELDCLEQPAPPGRWLWLESGCELLGEHGANQPRQAAQRIELALRLHNRPATLLGCLNTNDLPAAVLWLEQVLQQLDLPVQVCLENPT